MTDPAITEAAARAMCTREFPGKWDIISGPNQEWYRKLAVAALAAVTPLIRAQVLEEAAQVAEEHIHYSTNFGPQPPQSASDQIAAAIRALKEQP